MSPRSSIRTPPSAGWVVASRLVCVIVRSFQLHHELDGVVIAAAALAHLVNHLLDQEQAPSTWRLAALELCVDVRRRGIGDLAIAAVIDDLHDHCAVARRD